jgi:hypothetical protein
MKSMSRQPNLFEVIYALRSTGSLSGGLNGRQQQTD